MIEGWFGDEYLMLFGQTAASLHDAYGVGELLPGYRLLGLRTWDDFIVEDAAGARFTVPTVPAIPQHLQPYTLGDVAGSLKPDDRVAGRVRWCIKPIVFGGDPKLGDNVTWLPLEKHAEVVKWWNGLYRDLSRGEDPPAA